MNERTGIFPSFLEIQRKHDELLERQTEIEREPDGDSSTFWSEVRLFVERTRSTGALIDATQDRRAAQSILNYWGNSLYRATLETPPVYLAPFDPSLAPELPDFPAPYRGLAAFTTEDSDFFFGRERLVKELLARITQGDRFLAVVGASGSGKSSAILAGLLTALDVSPQSANPNHTLAVMVPGTKPLQNLAYVLSNMTQGPDRGSESEGQPLPSIRGAELADDLAYLWQWFEETVSAPLVLVVDQFEELFTLCKDEAERRAFIQLLIRLIQDDRLPHLVVVSMRIEFVDNIVRLPDLDAIFRPGRVDIYPPDINELRAAIEKPAARVGLQFDEGIVDDLISKILGERAGLPLLQFTLTKLWEKRSRNRITREVYTQVGHPLQALERSAEAFYQNLLPEDQETLRYILLKLVHFDESQEVTSRRIPIEQLFQGNHSHDRVAWILNRLVEEERLIKRSTGLAPAQDADGEPTQGETIQVEIAHEALIRNWPRLVDWLEDERHRVRRRQRIGEDAAYWDALGREPGALYSALQLAEAQRIVAESDLPLSLLEKTFLESSQQEIDRDMAEEITRRVELERAQEKAAQQARRSRRLIWLSILLFLLALIPTTLILIELNMRRSNWTPVKNLPSDWVTSMAAVVPSDGQSSPRYCFGTVSIGVACSTNGTTWSISQTDLGTGGLENASEDTLRGVGMLAIDGVDPDRLYVFHWGKGIFRSDNGGADLSPTNLPIPDAVDRLAAYAGAVAAITWDAETDGQSLFVSMDMGQIWQRLDEFIAVDETVTDITFIPTASGHDAMLLVTTDSGVYKGIPNEAGTWQQILALPASKFSAIGPALEDGIFVATEDGHLYYWHAKEGPRELASFGQQIYSLAAYRNSDGALTAYLLLESTEAFSVTASGRRTSLGKPPASLLDLETRFASQVLPVPGKDANQVRVLMAYSRGLFEQIMEIDSTPDLNSAIPPISTGDELCSIQDQVSQTEPTPRR